MMTRTHLGYTSVAYLFFKAYIMAPDYAAVMMCYFCQLLTSSPTSTREHVRISLYQELISFLPLLKYLNDLLSPFLSVDE